MHHLISHRPHRSFLYVDDIFAMLAAQHSTELTCLIICFLAAVNAPISWKKAQIGHCITWCGWSFDLLTDTALEAMLGLLTWATTMSPQLRPFLAPLYNDLHSAKGTLHSIPASQWTHFYQSLDDRACVQHTAGMWLPKQAKLLEVGNIKIESKADVPRLAWQRMRGHRMQFILPTGCDNTAAESGINKLFSTAEPLSTFLRMVADWAHRHNVQLAVSHLAGEKNTWADELSWDKLHRFIHRNTELPLAFLAENCQCISLHPPDAHWPSSLLAASS
ncbi:rpsB [Symbiodinium natans]|uniref:RpsB protein n=1 Tax=Symbiodinium natans TaxID=878477 RepID=A0A812RK57_9DINO|nr:rpsB [Symbiodinium natans]